MKKLKMQHYFSSLIEMIETKKAQANNFRSEGNYMKYTSTLIELVDLKEMLKIQKMIFIAA